MIIISGIWYGYLNNHAQIQVKHYVTYIKSKNVDMEAFRSDLHNQNRKEIEKYCNIYDAIEKWETMLLEVVNRHMPFN